MSALLLCCSASRAHAGNDDGILLGNGAALVAGAVISTVDDGSALWYNPAGLALSERDSVNVGANAFALRHYRMPGIIQVDGGSSNSDFTEILAIPSAVTYARRLGKLVGGLGLFASQIDNYTLRNKASLPVDAQQRTGELGLIVSQQDAHYHLALGLAGKLPRGFTFGAALFGDYYAESASLQISSRTDSPSATVAATVSDSLWQDKTLGLHVRAGVTYQPRPGVRLGASLQTAGRYIYVGGRSTDLTSAAEPNQDGIPAIAVEQLDHTYGRIHLGRYSPWRIRIGGSLRIPGDGTVSCEGDVATPVHDSRTETARNFTWNVRAGVRVPVTEALHLGAGLFTDRQTEPSEDASRVATANFYGGTLGGQYDSHLRLAGSASRDSQPRTLTFSNTLAFRYAYGFGKTPGFDLEGNTSFNHLRVHEFTVHLGSGVNF